MWGTEIFLYALFSILKVQAKTTMDSSKPHVIFILVDDLGWNDVGFHGMTDIPTPNIDALAENSIVLNNYYVCNSCTPSRGALLTGLYPSRMGAQNVLNPHLPWGLPLDQTLLPQRLAKLGYQNIMIGKWHLGHYKKEFTPTERGFHYHYGTWYGAVNYWTQKADEIILNSSDLVGIPKSLSGQKILLDGLDFRENMNVVTNKQHQYMTDIYTEKAVDIINKHDTNKPMFLFLAHHAVHKGSINIEHRAPPKYAAQFPHIQDKIRKHFAGALAALDFSVGQVMKAIYRRKMLENSIIVLSTDNGVDLMSVSVNGGSNWPLRGQKQTYWEGGVRGIGLIWSPVLTPKVYHNLMHITDWFPTIYAAAGGKVEDLGQIDGMNFWNHFLTNDDRPIRREVLIHYDPILNYGALRIGDFKVVFGENFVNLLNSGWKSASYRENQGPRKAHSVVAKVLEKFYQTLGKNNRTVISPVAVNCGEEPRNDPHDCNPNLAPCLFNVALDPCEYKNLAKVNKKVLMDMLESFNKYKAAAIPPPYYPGEYYANPEFYNGIWEPWRDEKFDRIRRVMS